SEAVVAGRVLGRNVRRVDRKGVRDVGVRRLAEPVELPMGGNREWCPGGVIEVRRPEVAQRTCHRVGQVKLPETVEAQTGSVGGKRRPRRQRSSAWTLAEVVGQ